MQLYSKIYQESNNNQWVVFLHGAGGSSSIWFRQLKTFLPHFNLLTLDLRGHGKSCNAQTPDPYTFDLVMYDIIEVLDIHHINKAHFVGISLGSLLANLLAIRYPDRVHSLVLGGSITRVNYKSRVLLAMGNLTKRLIPYMWLYKIFATVILPKRNHTESRKLFIKEAERMDQKQFIKWFALTNELPQILKKIRQTLIPQPTLFIQGKEDHMFLEDLLTAPSSQKKSVEIIPNCGHVVNIENPTLFNQIALSFLQKAANTLAVHHPKFGS